MKNNLRTLTVFTAGALTGTGITFVLMKDKYEAIIDEELAAMKDYYKPKEEWEPEDEEFEAPVAGDMKEKNSIDQGIVIDPVNYDNYAKKYTGSEENERAKRISKNVTYGKINPVDSSGKPLFTEPQGVDEDDYHEDDDYIHPIDPGITYRDDPYVITFEQYMDEQTHVDKVDLLYFMDDKILVDDQDDVVDDIENVIGLGSLMTFGNNPEDPDTIHVRNLRLGADYEITQVANSYRSVVLGEDD